MTRRANLLRVAAVVAVVAVIATIAVVSRGFDVAQTPLNSSSVWALQGDGNRYARINTELHEIDTVKDVKNPSELVQSTSAALVLMEGYGRIGGVDPGRPQNFTDETEGLGETPTGTATIAVSADFVAYLTDNGRIFVARIADGASASAVHIDPYSEQNATPGAVQQLYSADSIAIGADGVLYAFAITERTVLRYDLLRGQVLGQDDILGAPSTGGTALTVVGTTWVLLSGDGGSLWINGAEPVDTGFADDAELQRPSASGDSVLVATRSSLSAFALGDGAATALVTGGARGIPARPAALDGEMYAAWVDENGTAGLMWSSATGEQPLDYAGQTLDAEPLPVLRTNGSRMILNDTQSGWVWTLPDGELVASSQDWGLAAAATQETADNEEQASVVSERKPPVAVADQFGVRAGQLVNLPVLLNDHDPNEDVLTIDPSTIIGPDPSFGTVAPANNSQDLVIQVAAGASGTATFSYRATDGTQSGGLTSEPATVTLTVYGNDVNSAPVWCGVLECQREWPRLQVQPGSAASVEVLRGWVDPEGDPIYVASAVNLGDIGSVASTPDGTVLFQHPDASLPGGDARVTVRVADIRGASTEKELTVDITSTPSLLIEPFAITAAVGEPISIDPARYISGITGSYAISAAKTQIEDQADISVDNGATTFTFTTANAGEFFVNYTVTDAATELIGVVRVTAVASGSTQLATSPITVFVRPKADSTVDVFSAVTNPSNRVLLLSEALPAPIGAASLDVEVVSQRLLRVKGTTADGQPGPLGTVGYTISDGTGNALSTARGEATVILLPSAASQAPVAVPDAVTVRAGTQIDIPVLANDLAPDGNALVLNPDAITFDSIDGLAFASGATVRLLAPQLAGEYEIGYTVYSAGAPEMSAKTLISVTVTPEGENGAPRPRTLIGRVLAGASVSIPFDNFGLDPDGDAVILDAVVSQPDSGSAAIAPTADAIVYTSVSGFSGPVSFEYRVKDQFGETGTASVRVGVLDQESDPSPVTYSDYVEVQLGASSRVTVRPAANDIDPGNKALTVTEVVPDAPIGSPEYDDLAALVSLGDDGIVTLTAGAVLGTKSFFYTVSNSTGDTNSGLIVMKVVRESVPDRPTVVDTYLTIEDRAAFATGVDVVTGKVTWNSGSVADLSLSLWGSPGGFAVSGRTISGSLPSNTIVIPFALTGLNNAGVEVSTYGFLRVPGRNDIILALRTGTVAEVVNEGESTSFDLSDLVVVPEGESLAIDTGGVHTAGKRTQASCALTQGTELQYSAGADKPWSDYCAIPTKLVGQDDYTELIVPISVIPEIPLPIMRAAAITHSPAAAPVTYDLLRMVDWAGKADNESLVFQTAYSGDQFSVVQNGSVVTVYALDAANPGRENTVKVSLASHPDVAASVLSLKVGPAPTELPKGGTVSKECTQAGNNTSCIVQVIGIPGEVNIYRTALAVVSVSVPPSCSGVTMDVSDSTHIRASWTSDAPGGKCTASFVVKDPQGKISPDDRSGTFLLDLKGFPKAPSALTQSGYGDKLIKLSVNPGPATAAYPALSGFTVYRGTSVVSRCTPLGVCDDIIVTANGDKQTYEAVAVNDVGESKTKAAKLAWAYRAPIAGAPTATPIFDAAITTTTQGRVRVDIPTPADTTATGFTVTGRTGTEPKTGNLTSLEVTLPVGSRTVVVTPVNDIDIPTGTGPVAASSSTAVAVAGTARITSAGTVETIDSSSIQVLDTVFDANFSSLPRQVRYIASKTVGGTASCTTNASTGALEWSTTGRDSATSTITGLDANTQYDVLVCVSYGFGTGDSSATALTGVAWNKPAAPVGHTYGVTNGSANGQFTIMPTGPGAPAGFEARYSDFNASFGVDPAITVRYCLLGFDDNYCSEPSIVTAADPARVYQISLLSVSLATCTVGETLVPTVVSAGGTASFPTVTSYRYREASGPDIYATGPVPSGAVDITEITTTITWASNSGSDSYSATLTTTFMGLGDSPVTCNTIP